MPTSTKKSLYLVCVKYLNLRALKDLPETKWTNFVELGTSPKGCWRSLYKKPIEKKKWGLAMADFTLDFGNEPL